MPKTSKKLKISNRSDIPMFMALDMLREVNERTAAGIDIKRMGAGQPNVGAPHEVLEYAISIIKADPRQGYTEALGMPDLCGRISEYYKDYYGVAVNPRNIAITPGSSGGFILTFLAAFDAGDKVAITTPTYPAYRNIFKALDRLRNIRYIFKIIWVFTVVMGDLLPIRPNANGRTSRITVRP